MLKAGETPTFTEEDVCELTSRYGGTYNEDGDEIFSVVKHKITDVDQEKSSSQIEVAIKENASGRFFKATLGESPWWKQGQVNAGQKWSEVFKKTKKVVTFK